MGPETVAQIFAIFERGSFGELKDAYAGVEGVDAELERLSLYFSYLEDMDLGDFVRFDPRIVRGLAYYTGIVFEIFDRKGELRAVCGGGRYDQLLRTLSAADLPALGFGMGDVVLAELLADRGLLAVQPTSVDYYLVAVSEAERPLARRLAHRLRDAGYGSMYSLKPAGVGRQFKDANARGARHAVVLGPAEVEAGEAIVREMETGTERRVALEELASQGLTR